jgi:phosphoglycolate phosphatase-like HAD superfamily hydrolase
MKAKNRLGIAARLLPVVVLLGALAAPMAFRAQEHAEGDLLPSWRDGQAKLAILSFVHQVTDPSSPKYVKPEARIAAFDDGGTLSTEWPIHVNQMQMVFARQRVKAMAKQHDMWKYQPPFNYILDNDDKKLGESLKDMWNMLDLMRAVNQAVTVDEFSAEVQAFLKTAKHPKFKVPFTEVAYQPMLELLALLRANDFKIYIVTNYGADFVRELSESVYGIPRDRVIGTTVEYAFKENAEGGDLARTTNLDIYNEKAAKAQNIQLHIGRRPILVAGNTNGDLAMMSLAAGGKQPFLNLVLRHDDAQREFAYEEKADKVLQTAQSRGWTVISMQSDFNTVFAFQKNDRRFRQR